MLHCAQVMDCAALMLEIDLFTLQSFLLVTTHQLMWFLFRTRNYLVTKQLVLGNPHKRPMCGQDQNYFAFALIHSSKHTQNSEATKHE